MPGAQDGAASRKPIPTVWNRAAYERDALAFLRSAARTGEPGGGAFWYAPNRLCVVDPHAARDILSNRDDAYLDHSDFFYSRAGMPGPRAAQVRIGHDARTLMQAYLTAHADRLPELVARRLSPVSRWPDAGNRLLYDHLGSLLLRPDAPPTLRRVIELVIDRAVLAGARERHGTLSRTLFRARMHYTLATEIGARKRHGAGVPGRFGKATDPADLLDVVIAGGLDADEEQLVEVYLSFVFALVGSLGFALGWSLYLLGTSLATDAPPSWIVREALRLWPVAWLFGRRPRHAHTIAGVPVEPDVEVDVCAWLVHRDGERWTRPDEFVPERWAGAKGNPAYVPFGFGPHACAGAGVSMRLLSDLVRLLTRDWRMNVRPLGSGPHLGPALAPPPFEMELRTAMTTTRERR